MRSLYVLQTLHKIIYILIDFCSVPYAPEIYADSACYTSEKCTNFVKLSLFLQSF